MGDVIIVMFRRWAFVVCATVAMAMAIEHDPKSLVVALGVAWFWPVKSSTRGSHERALLTFHAERSGVCRWTADEDSDSWDASCGRKWSFLTDGPVENGVTFCHGCGRQVEVVR